MPAARILQARDSRAFLPRGQGSWWETFRRFPWRPSLVRNTRRTFWFLRGTLLLFLEVRHSSLSSPIASVTDFSIPEGSPIALDDLH